MRRDNSSPLGRGGFSLVELAVALLIGGILITTVFQMMSGQARVSAVQSGREETQQNTRGALEILSSELRSAAPQMILDAGPQTITFMQPRAWGLVCPPAPATNGLTIVVPNVGADAAWTAGRSNGILLRAGPGSYVPAPANGLATRAWITSSQVLGPPTAANCPMAAQGNLTVVQLGLSQNVAPSVGQEVALYTLTRYDVATANGLTWLRRNSSVDNSDNFVPQPLAGPLADGRFNLQYLNATGGIVDPALNPAAVAQVRVRVVTESTQRLNGRVQRDSGETVVTLRNTN